MLITYKGYTMWFCMFLPQQEATVFVADPAGKEIAAVQRISSDPPYTDPSKIGYRLKKLVSLLMERAKAAADEDIKQIYTQRKAHG